MSLRLAGGLFRTDCVGSAVASSHQAGSLALHSRALLGTYGELVGGNQEVWGANTQVMERSLLYPT